MCGIAGKLAFRGATASAEDARRMADQMICRGPDGEGVWIDALNGVSLAHRRLSIIDLDPRANQPMHDQTGRAVVTFNGEIYNFQDLRRELGVSDWRTTSDTEVLLRLYARYGLDGIEAY